MSVGTINGNLDYPDPFGHDANMWIPDKWNSLDSWSILFLSKCVTIKWLLYIIIITTTNNIHARMLGHQSSLEILLESLVNDYCTQMLTDLHPVCIHTSALLEFESVQIIEMPEKWGPDSHLSMVSFKQVIDIAQVRVRQVGYWHSSDIGPESCRPVGSCDYCANKKHSF